MPHPCSDWRELLSAYHDHQLSPEEGRPMEAHLDECAACRATLAQWEADRARFTAVYADSTAGTAMKAQILQEIRTMATPSTEVSLPLGWLRWLIGLSAAAVLASVLLFAAVLVTQRPQQRVALAPMDQDGRTTDQSHRVLDSREGYAVNDVKAYTPPMASRDRVASGISNGFSRNLAPQVVTSPVPQEKMPSGYRARLTFYDGEKSDAFDNTYDALFTAPERNYGIPGGMKMAYDAEVTVQVQDALAEGRRGLRVVRENGGFVIDFSFGDAEGERPWATLRGKVPADKAETTLAAIERMGRVRALTIAGEDLTTQFQQQLDAIKKLNEHAEKLEKLEDKSRRTYPALQAEQQRITALQQATEARRQLHGLAAKHDLVEFSASFVEEQPRAQMSFQGVVAGTQTTLHYALLLLGTVAVLLLTLGMIASPWMVVRYLRRK